MHIKMYAKRAENGTYTVARYLTNLKLICFEILSKATKYNQEDACALKKQKFAKMTIFDQIKKKS